MKKITLALLVFIFNCANFNQGQIENAPPLFSNEQEAMEWVHNNIKYDYGKFDRRERRTQTPEETLELRSGVCRDQSILLMWIIYNQFKKDPNLVGFSVDGADYGHTVVQVIVDNNIIFLDPTYNIIYHNFFYIFNRMIYFSSYHSVVHQVNNDWL